MLTEGPTSDLTERFEHALLAIDRIEARRVLDDRISGEPVLGCIERVVVPALDKIGSAWERGQVALSQVYMAGRLCEELVDALLPPASPDRKEKPRAAIAVLDDHHMLGKRMVYAVLRASGYDVADYGRGSAAEIADRAVTGGIELLLISTLMLPSALGVRELRQRLGPRSKVRIAVGGAPFRFDPELWREVGADACGQSASDAIRIVSELAGGVS